ncbi:MAG: magnesium transporter [candidate division NC10 bacterium]|nr:magnesium transporter [candidate division NC10 bacterium]
MVNEIPQADITLTRLRQRPVLDATGAPVGCLKDLVVHFRGIFPQVTKILVARPTEEDLLVGWEQVAGLDPEPGGALRLACAADAVRPQSLRLSEMLLAKNILDKKVMDTARRRVVRVNDVGLKQQDGRYVVVWVDVGMRGLLRHFLSEPVLEAFTRTLRLSLPRDVVSWEHVEPIETELTRAKRQAVYSKLARLHPADIADIVEELNPSERATILQALDAETAGEALAETETEVQAGVLQMLEPEKASDLLERMEPDEAADVLSEMPESRAQEILEGMEPEEAGEVAELLEHPEESAGGLMTTEFVAFPPHLTAAAAIEHLRERAGEAETISTLYVTDPDGRLLGVLSLRQLLTAPPTRTLEDLVEKHVIQVPPEADLKDVAETLSKYNLLALPVVGSTGVLEGIVTVDDVLSRLLPLIWKQRAAKKYL